MVAKGNIRGPEDSQNDLTKTDDGIFWMNINSDFYWMVDLYEAKVGSNEVSLGQGETANIYINSGTSINYFPDTAYDLIIEKAILDHDCTLMNFGLYKCKECSGPGD